MKNINDLNLIQIILDPTKAISADIVWLAYTVRHYRDFALLRNVQYRSQVRVIANQLETIRKLKKCIKTNRVWNIVAIAGWFGWLYCILRNLL